MKKNINSRIFRSHIIIIIISVLLSSVAFRIALHFYSRNQIKSQLVSAEELVRKSMNLDVFSSGSDTASAKEEMQNLLKVNRILKQTQTFLDINYSVIDGNANIIYPKNINDSEYNLLESNILPQLKSGNKIKIAQLLNNKVAYIKVNGQEYCVTAYNIKKNLNSKKEYLLLFANTNKTSSIISNVRILQLFILVITALVAMGISKLVARKISKPITELSNYAKKIGDREYEVLPEEYEDDDMDNLAATMHDMAIKLSAYDSTIKAFMQNASHELRTPMMSIQGYAEGLKLGVVEDKEAALNIIIEESKRLNLIVEDLLYLSKLDNPQENLNMEKLQLEEILKSCIERVNGIAVKNHKKIILSVDNNIYLMAEDEKITRAIINILGNCLRYVREIIRIEAKQRDSEIIINIVDDGPGFEEKDLPHIFERFYKGKGGEHGLGLAITKSILEKHGGSIIAKNSENSGACFEIRLPHY